MKFKTAAGCTVSRTNEDVGFRLVIEAICPKCGTNVGSGCLIKLNVKGKDGHGRPINGYGLVTSCCHMVVAVDEDFSRWVEYQSAEHDRRPEVALPFNEMGMVCDISDGVEAVGS